uniref:Discs, large (Drosophila) homolog-associated protein 1b n=1 Tax=Neolamprologus brichardi TaxID=32507 RepID=A0A3Q4GTS1_NEOBR
MYHQQVEVVDIKYPTNSWTKTPWLGSATPGKTLGASCYSMQFSVVIVSLFKWQVVQRSVCQRDGRWFLKLLQAETDRMDGWCRQMELDHSVSVLIVLEKMRSAMGSAQLLMSQKFEQFRELCEENLNPKAHPRPVASDLAGFWDMLQLSIENISLKFDELHQLRANNWRPLDPPDRKVHSQTSIIHWTVNKKPSDRSLESSEKQRQEARKRLMAAKRAASVRQNSATESADSIEIYIPEAQTRL